MSSLERRYVALDAVELRVIDGEGEASARLVGYPIRYNSPSLDLGGFRETIAPGAFDASLAEDDIRALFNHDANQILGRTAAGTLHLTSDDRGVKMEVDLPATTAGRDLAESVRRGDVTGGSFGFRVVSVKDAEWSEEGEMPGGGKMPMRIVKLARLFDVGPVTFPAYLETSMAVRSESEVFDALEELAAWRSKLAAEARARELGLRRS